MRFELKVATRYLGSSRLQTALILAGVAVGILAFTFMAALINGLATKLTNDVIGNLAHVTLTPLVREPRQIADPSPASAVQLMAVQRGTERRAEITGWRPLVDSLRRRGDVLVVSPSAQGGGFARRGEKVMPISLIGQQRDHTSSIFDLSSGLVSGSLELGPEDVLLGVTLAEELGVETGSRIVVASERGRSRSLNVRGLFDVGSANANERLAFVDLAVAQSLLDLDGKLSRIEVKLLDLQAAPRIAQQLAGETGLEARNWIDDNRRLQEALKAQGSTGTLIKIFSLMTIVIGVAAVLLLAAVRRRAEIGILRSFGVTRGAVLKIFLLQGAILGLVGSLLGSSLGWGFCQLILKATRRADGTPALPVDPAQGEYLLAIALATLASTLAAVLPARRAAAIDPVEAIQQ